MRTKNHPGVYVPPPLIYAVFFLCAVFFQHIYPIGKVRLHSGVYYAIGWVFITLFVLFAFIAIRRFVLSKNTLVTIKPANSLQTTGIYSMSRNPMYLSLLFLYAGLSLIIGNWWNMVLLPVLIITVQEYVIRREEKYLEQRFGQQYFDYKKKVRRWL